VCVSPAHSALGARRAYPEIRPCQMTFTSITTIGLLVGIAALGLFFAVLFRREPRKALNIAVLTVGLALLTYGHLQWAGRRESEEVKRAMFIRHVVAGWAMVGIGLLGLQSGRDHKRSNGP
jgi:hypothetical protein